MCLSTACPTLGERTIRSSAGAWARLEQGKPRAFCTPVIPLPTPSKPWAPRRSSARARALERCARAAGAPSAAQLVTAGRLSPRLLREENAQRCIHVPPALAPPAPRRGRRGPRGADRNLVPGRTTRAQLRRAQMTAGESSTSNCLRHARPTPHASCPRSASRNPRERNAEPLATATATATACAPRLRRAAATSTHPPASQRSRAAAHRHHAS